jgi:TRAP-type C4-dicarboxylate transport system substrate-binding protein
VTWNLQGFQINYETLPMPQSLELAKNVEARTNGKFKIHVALEGELGVNRDNYNEAAQAGIIELIQHSSPLLERIIPHMGVYQLPQLAVTPQEWEKLMVALGETDQAAMKKYGFQLLSPGVIYCDWNQEMFTKEPVKDMTNLDGLKVRVWQSAMEKLIAALNGDPVYMAFTEVYMAMQRGVVDGFITGPPAAEAIPVWEIGTQFYPIGLPGGGRFLVVNTKAFESLPEEYQKILVEEGEKYGESARQGVAGEVKEALAAFEEHGMTLNELSSAEREAWRAAALPLWDEFAKADPNNAKVLEMAKEVLGIK